MPPWAPGAVVAALAAWPLFRWLVLDATWLGTTSAACVAEGVRKAGACWPAVTQNIPLLLGGRYPQEMLWRPLVVIALGVASFLAPALWARARPVWLLAPLAVLPIQLLVQSGHASLANTGLPPVPTELWGGFSLTWLLSASAILTALVPGLALALARTSSWRVVSILATGFIETVRGVPLITILFVGHFLFPLFLPPSFGSPSEITRAILALAAFLSAYTAEVWRGGLLAVARGQTEAASALALGRFDALRHVVFPQAARVALPGLVATFIGLFKDTSLVTIVGLLDLLGIARAIPRSPEWLGFDVEPLLFAAALYAGASMMIAGVGRALAPRWRT